MKYKCYSSTKREHSIYYIFNSVYVFILQSRPCVQL